MADPVLLHVVYYEGDDDGAVLTGLQSAGLLPADFILSERRESKRPGKEGMVQELAPLVSPVNGAGRSAVVLRDLDDLEIDQVSEWFCNELTKALPNVEPQIRILPQEISSKRVLFFQIPGALHTGRVVVIPVGLPGDPEMRQCGIERFTVDDYIVRLARNQKVFESVTEFGDVQHSLAMRKLTEVMDLMRSNNLPIKNSKRLLHLLRAITGFRASPATFASRLIEKAANVIGMEGLRGHLTPLVDDLDEAAKILAPHGK
jgi:hypothetical protein